MAGRVADAAVPLACRVVGYPTGRKVKWAGPAIAGPALVYRRRWPAATFNNSSAKNQSSRGPPSVPPTPCPQYARCRCGASTMAITGSSGPGSGSTPPTSWPTDRLRPARLQTKNPGHAVGGSEPAQPLAGRATVGESASSWLLLSSVATLVPQGEFGITGTSPRSSRSIRSAIARRHQRHRRGTVPLLYCGIGLGIGAILGAAPEFLVAAN